MLKIRVLSSEWVLNEGVHVCVVCWWCMQVNRLPVIESGKVVGVVTRHDVLKGIYDNKTFM